MISRGYIRHLPNELRALIGLFLIVLSIGYFTGMTFVRLTSKVTPTGIIENYNGNESDEHAEVMKFKKSEHEMLSILHTHFLSLSVIFLIIGLLVYGCEAKTIGQQQFLMIEPMLSVLVTFSGIFLVWKGYEFMTYIVMISGSLMTFSFVASLCLITYNLIFKKTILE